MKSKHRYLCKSWQALLQQAVTLTSKGYIYYQLIRPKIEIISSERWLKIDKAIIKRFKLEDATPRKRYIHKRNGICNFYYIRHEDNAILLKTKGELIADELSTEIWKDIYKRPLVIQVSDTISVKIGLKGGDVNDKKLTCYLDRGILANIKAAMFSLLEKGSLSELEYRFNALNNIPRYSGINKQKVILKNELLEEAKRHGIKLKLNMFTVYTKKKNYKVY